METIWFTMQLNDGTGVGNKTYVELNVNTKTVAHLLNAIHTKMKTKLHYCDADDLTLYPHGTPVPISDDVKQEFKYIFTEVVDLKSLPDKYKGMTDRGTPLVVIAPRNEAETKTAVPDVKSLLVHGLPEMIMSGSLTDGSRSKNHTPAKCIVQPFGVLNDQGWNKNDVSCLYASMKGDRTKLQYASESDIQGHVKNVILDALGITSLDGITCLNELSVFGHRADIWLVARAGKPIGVVEIKKPGINLLNNGHVLGQLYNYMLRLQSFFGVKYVFGIVSTYQKWRFCWLPEANASAIKGTVLSIGLAPTPELPKHLQEQSSNQAQQSNHSHERTMFGTEVIDWNNPYLFRALCSVVIKMSKSPSRKVDLIDRKRPYIVADSKQWTWQRNPFSNKLTEIDLHHQGLPLLKDGEKLIFLDDFGAGADGRAWRACTRTGHGCVVKFSGSAETVELELRNWNTLYEDGAARIITLCAQKALLMPYLRPVDRHNSDEIKLVREMIQSVSQKGYCHSDLHWRHVGFRSPVKQKATTRNASLVPVMFDLTQLQKIDPVEALRKNLDQLKLDDSNENQ